jgi:hypothetical protein
MPEQVMQWSTPEDVAGMDCPTHPGTTCLISRWTDGKPTFYILDPVRGQGKAVATTKLGKSDDLTFALSQDGTHIALTRKGRLPGKVRIVDVKDRIGTRDPHSEGLGYRAILLERQR